MSTGTDGGSHAPDVDGRSPGGGGTMADRPAADAGRGPLRRHTRGRVVAPPTNPDADQTDDRPAPGRGDREPARRAGDGSAPTRLDPRDSWILEQRPPHWD
ncbi:hypothetical protein AVL62_05815 [Serinicoccus chungangensis]|uniref:Uncharacterized protein n=1 Tax=Serinicoccus chungangensis TaxID=767452 RepID=A0A0W8I8T2_9MICO|nr:hypothetical protein [Serinicoccus chungangensis]KUG55801.1 hypothetical protein AVL62_05815 [Serinicoccus chungangensis]